MEGKIFHFFQCLIIMQDAFSHANIELLFSMLRNQIWSRIRSAESFKTNCLSQSGVFPHLFYPALGKWPNRPSFIRWWAKEKRIIHLWKLPHSQKFALFLSQSADRKTGYVLGPWNWWKLKKLRDGFFFVWMVANIDF